MKVGRIVTVTEKASVGKLHIGIPIYFSEFMVFLKNGKLALDVLWLAY